MYPEPLLFIKSKKYSKKFRICKFLEPEGDYNGRTGQKLKFDLLPTQKDPQGKEVSKN